jgi:hypothetical protein
MPNINDGKASNDNSSNIFTEFLKRIKDPYKIIYILIQCGAGMLGAAIVCYIIFGGKISISSGDNVTRSELKIHEDKTMDLIDG